MSGLPAYIGHDTKRFPQPLHNGVYQGKVEYTADPLNIGRLKVRVPGIHPLDKGKVASTALPWALPCFMPGSFVVPEVGDTVMVSFNQGDISSPVYFGVVYGVLEEEDVRGRLAALDDPAPIHRESSVASVGSPSTPAANNDLTYHQAVGNDSPEESFMRRTSSEPLVRVYAKSTRGHTVFADDEAEKETFRIIDRFGQILSFDCPVKEEENKGNKSRRGSGEALAGTQLPLEKAVDGETLVTLMDSLRQFLQFTANNDGESTIELKGFGGRLLIEQKDNRLTLTALKGDDESDERSKLVFDQNVKIESEDGAVIEMKDGDITLSAK